MKRSARRVTRCNAILKPSLSFLPLALSGEKEEEAGEDGGPAGKTRTAEEASQSSGAALLLRFTFVHVEMRLQATAADCYRFYLIHAQQVHCTGNLLPLSEILKI